MDFFQSDNPEKAVATIKQIKDTLSNRNKQLLRNYKRIVRSEEWRNTMALARQEKWENRLAKKNRLKKYIIPEVLMNADPKYWSEAVKDHKYMKKHHPELII